MKIKIKEPCDADWSKMKIGLISRHCELCVKNVMDFTKMSREEILIYLFKNNNKSTCARMTGGQMDFHHQELGAIIEGTRKQKGNLPFVIMSLAALALLSCDNGTNSHSGFDPILGEMIPIELTPNVDSVPQLKKDSISTKHDSFSQGKIRIEEPTTQAFEPKKGEVDNPIDFITGDVEVFETGEIVPVFIPDPVEELSGLIAMPYEELMGDTIVSSQENIVFEIAEIMPEFVGGMDGLMSYLSDNIKYPKKAQKKGVEGRVFVKFIVEKDGSITHSEILRGINESMDKEALRVINSMPNWIPGKNNDEVVRTRFVIPIKYQLK